MAEDEPVADGTAADDDAPYLGEIRMFSFNITPKYWAPCEGQTLQISQNLALFSLIGTLYGGNGSTTFMLPDLRGRVPMDCGPTGYPGEAAGEAAHTLSQAEMPLHNHIAYGANTYEAQNQPGPDLQLSNSAGGNLYTAASNTFPMHPSSVSLTGGSKPHENRQPWIALNFCICLAGAFPAFNTEQEVHA
ncbi:phage tail protein [Nocardioides marmoriginsengisoli]|uniref:Phage tail protein n=1 Tax=Nocardioides marmoriginsengisoli TaxID=661483 RepID=A0A3N0CIP3_9ACTN|nr:tail fiber protein [Nocardioides marmoriginsengisoli]RNL63295.1 phage tail protein [Nocardioides marmoriginsengisoli]